MHRLEEFLGSWKGPATRVTVPELSIPAKREVLLVEKQTAQSHIRIGHLGVKPHNPDYHALRVMNEILGRGPASRLYREVRSQNGLAYSIRSYVNENEARGVIAVKVQTKAESACRTICMVLKILADMTREAPAAEELSSAKSSLINSHIFQFQSSFHLARSRLRCYSYGYAGDYLTVWPDRIQAVTAGDVLRVASDYVHPARSSIVVVGDPKRFDSP